MTSHPTVHFQTASSKDATNPLTWKSSILGRSRVLGELARDCGGYKMTHMRRWRNEKFHESHREINFSDELLENVPIMSTESLD